MESIRKQAGYLEGMLAAMQLPESEPSTRLTQGIVSLLGALAERVETMDDLIGELNDYVESIDDDLNELEGFHDDDTEGEFGDLSIFSAEEHEPLRLIKNDKPSREPIPVRCPKCGKVFLVYDADGIFLCPECSQEVSPEKITPDNTPFGEKIQ